jgi:hypothetical protein
MITPLGSLSLAVALPGVQAGLVAGQLGIGLALPDIQARLAAYASFTPVVQDYAAMLAQAQAMVTKLLEMIALGLTPPSLSVQIAIVADIIAVLNLNVLSINAKLTIILDLLSSLTAVGVSGYVYSGPQNAMGSELATALGVSAVPCNAIVLVTQNGTTWTAMQTVFKTTP